VGEFFFFQKQKKIFFGGGKKKLKGEQFAKKVIGVRCEFLQGEDDRTDLLHGGECNAVPQVRAYEYQQPVWAQDRLTILGLETAKPRRPGHH
jgi:hypothetical protein